MVANRKRLGEILIERGVIDKQQLKSALSRQERWGKKLGETLVDMEALTERKLCEILGEQFNVPAINLSRFKPEAGVLKFLTADFCEKHMLIPVAVRPIKGKDRLVVAAADPSNLEMLDQARFLSGHAIAVAVAPLSEIRLAIRECYFSDRAATSPDEITLSKMKPEDTHMDVFRAGKYEEVKANDASRPSEVSDAAPYRSAYSYPPPVRALDRLVQTLVKKRILTEEEANGILHESR